MSKSKKPRKISNSAFAARKVGCGVYKDVLFGVLLCVEDEYQGLLAYKEKDDHPAAEWLCEQMRSLWKARAQFLPVYWRQMDTLIAAWKTICFKTGRYAARSFEEVIMEDKPFVEFLLQQRSPFLFKLRCVYNKMKR